MQLEPYRSEQVGGRGLDHGLCLGDMLNLLDCDRHDEDRRKTIQAR